jgi:hypothetical protein
MKAVVLVMTAPVIFLNTSYINFFMKWMEFKFHLFWNVLFYFVFSSSLAPQNYLCRSKILGFGVYKNVVFAPPKQFFVGQPILMLRHVFIN